jgi:hypothetical protein
MPNSMRWPDIWRSNRRDAHGCSTTGFHGGRFGRGRLAAGGRRPPAAAQPIIQPRNSRFPPTSPIVPAAAVGDSISSPCATWSRWRKRSFRRGGLDFIRGGAGDEWTMRENLAAFERVAIEPNYLSGAKQPDISTTILGARLSLPVITAPMGGHRLAHEEGEVATASGTAAAGSLVAISSVSNVGLEQVMAGSAGPKWFQIYLPEDKGCGSRTAATRKASRLSRRHRYHRYQRARKSRARYS